METHYCRYTTLALLLLITGFCLLKVGHLGSKSYFDAAAFNGVVQFHTEQTDRCSSEQTDVHYDGYSQLLCSLNEGLRAQRGLRQKRFDSSDMQDASIISCCRSDFQASEQHLLHCAQSLSWDALSLHSMGCALGLSFRELFIRDAFVFWGLR